LAPQEEIDMAVYRDMSIQRKLTMVILSTTLLALSLACLGFELYERASYRKAMTNELSALADTVGANTAAALAFNDRKSAADMLAALRAERNIVAACLYDNHGKVFADYRRAGSEAFKMPAVEVDGARFEPESVTLFRTVSLDSGKAGSIAIISDLSALHAKIRQYTGISAMVIALSVLAQSKERISGKHES
jgi:uncharacterized membrane protein affecting hemolysin expression